MKLPTRLVSVAALSVAVAGCSYVNPITTSQAYDASDGVSVEVGDVRGLNLLVITEAEGGPGVLIGSFYNPSGEDVEIAASIDGEAIVTVEVPAGATVKLGGEEGETHVTGTSTAAPGLIQDVFLQAEGVGQITGRVPVLDGTLPEYLPELEGLASLEG